MFLRCSNESNFMSDFQRGAGTQRLRKTLRARLLTVGCGSMNVVHFSLLHNVTSVTTLLRLHGCL